MLFSKPFHNKKSNDAEALCADINKEDQLQNGKYFTLYETSNEHNWNITLDKIAELEAKETTNLRIALLIGESHILSIAPEISQHADLIICNDVNTQLNQYTQFLVSCMRKASSRQEFEQYYKEMSDEKFANPLVNNKNSIDCLWQNLTHNIIKEKFFLSTEERFLACKKAVDSLYFSWSKVDLFKPNECILLKELIDKNHGAVTVLNVTNLHNYCQGSREQYKQAINVLLDKSDNPFLLYSLSYGSYGNASYLISKLSVGTEDYFHFYNEGEKLNRDRPDNCRIDPMINLANLILKTKALELNLPLRFVPKLSLIEESIRISVNTLPNTSLSTDIRHTLYLLLKDLLPWDYQYYYEEAELYKKPMIFITDKLYSQYLYLKNTYVIRKDNCACYLALGRNEKSISDRILYGKISIEDTKLLEEILNPISLPEKPTSIHQLKEDGLLSEDACQKIEEVIISRIGKARYDLTRFYQPVNVSRLRDFIEEHIPAVYVTRLIAKTNIYLKQLAKELQLPPYLIPEVKAIENSQELQLILPKDIPLNYAEPLYFILCAFVDHEIFYVDEADRQEFILFWLKSCSEKGLQLPLHELHGFVSAQQEKVFTNDYGFFSGSTPQEVLPAWIENPIQPVIS
ncbi:hypothetical protein Lsan_3494 [Legionella santicrucis]|uniref:Uncharacterized protein n=1 Tax=Legionella santicrucis TaxID=45074 RepID=A0A0W0YB27_9GAMM|nr:hypothetical protein [Legionella santicrucis]KTD53830.1 hypothetical protein Lsan_3494 [Legionella santicrucis]